jgi:hypothetical protein
MEAQREYSAAPVALKMIVTSLKMAFVVYLTYLPVCCMHTMSKSSSKSSFSMVLCSCTWAVMALENL